MVIGFCLLCVNSSIKKIIEYKNQIVKDFNQNRQVCRIVRMGMTKIDEKNAFGGSYYGDKKMF